jgi:hypothetical protein
MDRSSIYACDGRYENQALLQREGDTDRNGWRNAGTQTIEAQAKKP